MPADYWNGPLSSLREQLAAFCLYFEEVRDGSDAGADPASMDVLHDFAVAILRDTCDVERDVQWSCSSRLIEDAAERRDRTLRRVRAVGGELSRCRSQRPSKSAKQGEPASILSLAGDGLIESSAC
ncbi:MAG: hypothetical protein ACE37K_04140 [Planctomycetota bacterium]